jgi:hypothetical protein
MGRNVVELAARSVRSTIDRRQFDANRPKKSAGWTPAQLSTTEKEEKSGTAREVSHLSRASNGGKRYLNSMTDHPEIGFKKISTRRFWARPASVALSATGCVWPRPSALRRLRATPRSPR